MLAVFCFFGAYLVLTSFTVQSFTPELPPSTASTVQAAKRCPGPQAKPLPRLRPVAGGDERPVQRQLPGEVALLSSSSVHRDVAYGSFSRRSGTLMKITGVHNAKDIQALSMLPSEGEILILPSTDFEDKLAV
jgi:hypothetical protein